MSHKTIKHKIFERKVNDAIDAIYDACAMATDKFPAEFNYVGKDCQDGDVETLVSAIDSLDNMKKRVGVKT